MVEAADHTVLIGFLAAGTAIAAALIAAVTADIRQRRQLRHDREMQDLAELRSLLDDAAVALEAASYALVDAIVQFDSIPLERHDELAERTYAELRREGFAQASREFGGARDTMMTIGRRIAIRTGGEPVEKTYAIAIDVVSPASERSSRRRGSRMLG